MDSYYRMTIVERWTDVNHVHHIAPDGVVWATRGRTILRGRDRNWEHFGRFPFSRPTDYFGWSRLTQRVSRADKCNLFVNSNGRVLGIRANVVYSILPGGKLRPLLQIQGDCVLHGGICEDSQGWTYFGEYFVSQDPLPVRIWRISPDLDAYELAHELPAGSATHIHGTFSDPYDPETLWVTVGDRDREACILRTDSRFRSVERLGDGTGLWRPIHLFFTPDHVCWLTDSPHTQNYACRLDRSSGELEVGEELPATGWYGLTTTDGLHVGFTTVEPYPGVHTNQSSVLVSEDAFHWVEVASFCKDRWKPAWLFKCGVISCPSGPMASSGFYVSGEGLVGFDGISLRLRIDGDCP